MKRILTALLLFSGLACNPDGSLNQDLDGGLPGFARMEPNGMQPVELRQGAITGPTIQLGGPFAESTVISLGGVNYKASPGGALLDTFGQAWIQTKVDSFASHSLIDWINVTADVPWFNMDCSSFNPYSDNWATIIPWTDAASLHFCTNVPVGACTTWIGTYRAFGDGNGGPRGGLTVRNSAGNQWLLALKTADNHSAGIGGPPGCGINGPGTAGTVMMIPVPSNGFH